MTSSTATSGPELSPKGERCAMVAPSDAVRAAFDEQGYVLFPGFAPEPLLAALQTRVRRLQQVEGDRAGAEFKQEPGCIRLANLVNKGSLFAQVIADPTILGCVAHVLGPEFKLSSLNARTALPGASAQPLHADMGAIADERGHWVCNTVWMLDDFTLTNGALRAVPGSHRGRTLPQEQMADPLGPHPAEVLITGSAGTVVVMNAHLWHGGTANQTDGTRTALHAFYCRRDKPQQQYQAELLNPLVQRRLSSELRWLLALDDPENDRLARTAHVRSGFLK